MTGSRVAPSSHAAIQTALNDHQADLFSGLVRRNRLFAAELVGAMHEVVDQGELIDGPALRRFEGNFAAVAGSRHCVGVANGLDALALSLEALGVGVHDEVLVPAHTFVATLLAVRRVGAVPVPVDVDPHSGLLRIDLIEQSLTARSRAIVAVHLHGSVLDVAQVRRCLEGRDDVSIVEDAAQAHGAVDSAGRPAGALGDIAAFSFYPTKNLGALGDGGCVTTSRDDLAVTVRTLSRYGSAASVARSGPAPLPRNSRLDTLQAAFLDVFLPHLGDWNAERVTTAARYHEAMANSRELQRVSHTTNSVFHHFVVRSENRASTVEHLERLGVPTRVHYPIPAYRHPALGSYSGPTYPGAESAAATAISIPMHPWLTDVEVESICEVLRGC